MGKPIPMADQGLMGLAGFSDTHLLKPMVKLHRDLCGKRAFFEEVVQGGILRSLDIHFQNVDAHKTKITANSGKPPAGSFLENRPLSLASFAASLK